MTSTADADKAPFDDTFDYVYFTMPRRCRCRLSGAQAISFSPMAPDAARCRCRIICWRTAAMRYGSEFRRRGANVFARVAKDVSSICDARR